MKVEFNICTLSLSACSLYVSPSLPSVFSKHVMFSLSRHHQYVPSAPLSTPVCHVNANQIPVIEIFLIADVYENACMLTVLM